MSQKNVHSDNSALTTNRALNDVRALDRVYDEAKLLTSSTLERLERLSQDHSALTGQHLTITLVADESRLKIWKDWAAQRYTLWKSGSSIPAGTVEEGVLILLFPKESRAEIVASDRLETLLPAQNRKRLLSEDIVPELDDQHYDHASLLATYRVLKALNSPLIESGEALEHLESTGIQDFDGELRFHPIDIPGYGSTVMLIMSAIAFAFVLHQFLSREAHFETQGWKPIAPWQGLRLDLEWAWSKIKREKTPRHLEGTLGTW